MLLQHWLTEPCKHTMCLQHWLTEQCKTQCFCNIGLQSRVKHAVFATLAHRTTQNIMFLQHWLTEPCKTLCFCNIGLQSRVKSNVFASFGSLIPYQSGLCPLLRGASAEDVPQGCPQDAPRMPQLRGVAFLMGRLSSDGQPFLRW